jgi:hypothetical protein
MKLDGSEGEDGKCVNVLLRHLEVSGYHMLWNGCGCGYCTCKAKIHLVAPECRVLIGRIFDLFLPHSNEGLASEHLYELCAIPTTQRNHGENSTCKELEKVSVCADLIVKKELCLTNSSYIPAFSSG